MKEKELVYPAVVYKDESNQGFTIAIKDVGIYVDSETIVDAYIRAKHNLCARDDCAIKFDSEINSPSDFEKIYKENNTGKTKNIVLLIDALA